MTSMRVSASASSPIGVFDSGVGGLTILRAVQQALPSEDLIYVADTAHVPYGQKTPEVIRERAATLAGFLLNQGVKAIVVACNTATAAAIDALRRQFPLPFIGVEPAVKPAVTATRSGVIGVLATPATLTSERFDSLVQRFGAGVRVLAQPCTGLAEHIERGELDGETTEQLLRGFVDPLLAEGADAIVLGCTHYPLVAHIVQRIAGPGVAVIENGTAVARELSRQLAARGTLRSGGSGRQAFWVSGSIEESGQTLARLWAADVRVEHLPAADDDSSAAER
jgi:glutamate racemase